MNYRYDLAGRETLLTGGDFSPHLPADGLGGGGEQVLRFRFLFPDYEVEVFDEQGRKVPNSYEGLRAMADIALRRLQTREKVHFVQGGNVFASGIQTRRGPAVLIPEPGYQTDNGFDAVSVGPGYQVKWLRDGQPWVISERAFHPNRVLARYQQENPLEAKVFNNGKALPGSDDAAIALAVSASRRFCRNELSIRFPGGIVDTAVRGKEILLYGPLVRMDLKLSEIARFVLNHLGGRFAGGPGAALIERILVLPQPNPFSKINNVDEGGKIDLIRRVIPRGDHAANEIFMALADELPFILRQFGDGRKQNFTYKAALATFLRIRRDYRGTKIEFEPPERGLRFVVESLTRSSDPDLRLKVFDLSDPKNLRLACAGLREDELEKLAPLDLTSADLERVRALFSQAREKYKLVPDLNEGSATELGCYWKILSGLYDLLHELFKPE